MKYIEITPNNQHSISLLKEFYRNFLKLEFEKDELDSYNQIIKYLTESNKNNKNSYHILVIL